ncbi:MAG: hypothetical protein GY787_30325 [Alteromonadales bacterium]|nr:hypothetical protein [Alteromonadales bacterium]
MEKQISTTALAKINEISSKELIFMISIYGCPRLPQSARNTILQGYVIQQLKPQQISLCLQIVTY